MQTREDGTKVWHCEGIGTGAYKFGRASTGTEQIALQFEVLEGPFVGRKSVWYGTLGSPEALELVTEVLEVASGKPLESWAKFFQPSVASGNLYQLHDLTRQRVTLVFEQGPKDERPYLAYVNRIGIAMKDEIVGAELPRLFAKLDRPNARKSA